MRSSKQQDLVEGKVRLLRERHHSLAATTMVSNTRSCLAQLWGAAGLPPRSLSAAHLTGTHELPSTFCIAELAQATIAASALAAAQVLAAREGADVTEITVDSKDALAEFRCEAFCTLDGKVSFLWLAAEGCRTYDSLATAWESLG